MLNESCKRQAMHWLALAGLSAMAATAQAADAAPAQNGVMTFPNVRVVTAPVASVKAASGQVPSTQAGLKAFIDPATGQIGQPTADQAAALDAAAPKRDAQSLSAPTTIYPAQGGVGIVLDESHTSYFVARKAADGNVVTDCVPGAKAAQAALKKPARRVSPVAATKGEAK